MIPAGFMSLAAQPLPQAAFGAVEATLQAAVQPGHLCLVTGPTGTGKLTLALKAALSLRDQGRATVFARHDEGSASGHERAAFHSALHRIRTRGQLPVVILEMRSRDDTHLVGALLSADVAVIGTLHMARPHEVQERLGALSGSACTAAGLVARLTACVGLRFLPKVCPTCSWPAEILTDQERAVMARIGVPEAALRLRGPGCRACKGNGRMGRHSISETLLPSDAMRQAAANGASDAVRRALSCPATRSQVLHPWSDSVRPALAAGALDTAALADLAELFGLD